MYIIGCWLGVGAGHCCSPLQQVQQALWIIWYLKIGHELDTVAPGALTFLWCYCSVECRLLLIVCLFMIVSQIFDHTGSSHLSAGWSVLR